jgi:hypothetical protein
LNTYESWISGRKLRFLQRVFRYFSNLTVVSRLCAVHTCFC